MLVGHQEVTKALSSQLPPVSVIVGPPSVGKRLVATHAAIVNDVSRVDFTKIDKLTVPEAIKLKKFMQIQPINDLKFALVDLDFASTAAINDLLKLLEQPSKYARFALISSKKVPSTLRTRSFKYTVGLLRPTELLQILMNKGLSEVDAQKVSHLGRVDLALKAYSNISAKTTALNVIQAVEGNDMELFIQAFKAVDDDAAEMLIALFEESAAQRWKIFNPDYLGAFSNKNVALNILSLWSNVSNARPKLAVRTALESVMKG